MKMGHEPPRALISFWPCHQAAAAFPRSATTSITVLGGRMKMVFVLPLFTGEGWERLCGTQEKPDSQSQASARHLRTPSEEMLCSACLNSTLLLSRAWLSWGLTVRVGSDWGFANILRAVWAWVPGSTVLFWAHGGQTYLTVDQNSDFLIKLNAHPSIPRMGLSYCTNAYMYTCTYTYNTHTDAHSHTQYLQPYTHTWQLSTFL